MRRVGFVAAAGAALVAGLVCGAQQPAPAQAPDAVTVRLLERVASMYGRAIVVVGKLPADFPATIPLPKAALLGSVGQERMAGMTGTMRVVARPVLYYDVPADRDGVVGTYKDALRGAGWKEAAVAQRVFNGGGGFTVAVPRAEIWCSAGDRPMLVTIVAPPEDVTALDVSVSTDQQGANLLCSRGGSPFADFPVSPLPTFTATSGVRITNAGPASDGSTTGARITSSAGIAAVFESFATQLRDAGWAPGETANAATLRSQKFTKTVDGKNYVALLSIDALDATHYVALADVSS